MGRDHAGAALGPSPRVISKMIGVFTALSMAARTDSLTSSPFASIWKTWISGTALVPGRLMVFSASL